MKKLNRASLLLLVPIFTFAQSYRVETKTLPLIEERVITLNSGTRSALGGKSRTTIKIDLPPGTKEWYYSFTTTPGPDGTTALNLALQLSGLLTTGGISLLSPDAVKIPQGSATLDVYLLDARNVNAFESKADRNGGTYYYKREGSVENTKQATVRVDDYSSGTWFVGLKNPSEWNAINIHLEVVAIVEEKVAINKTPDQQKAELFGSMGWKAYQKGEYAKAIELNQKAISFDSTLGWVWNNIGLLHLINGDLADAIDNYSKAIHCVKAGPHAKRMLGEMIKDLQNLIRQRGQVDGAAELLEHVQGEYERAPTEASERT